MAKHIKQITVPISNYLSQRFGHTLRGNKSADEGQLPPHLEWAKVRGEALLIDRFFSHFERHHIDDIHSQLFFWKQFRNNPNALPLIAVKTGLTIAFQKQVGQTYLDKTAEHEQHYNAYCCLLWDIYQNKNHSLLDISTYALFNHFAATIFPATAVRDDINKLKREIQKALAQQWNIRPEIKESFTTENEEVTFSLIARMGGYPPIKLLTQIGKRLKPTRLKAYQTALNQLENGALNIELPKPTFTK